MGEFTRPELLGPQHDRSGFDCGSPAQTDWLRANARRAVAEETARVYVTCPTAQTRVVGYFALAAGAVAQDDATERVRKGTGGYPIPVVILARLGVDRSVQGRGLGRSLVKDALRRVEQAADIVGIRALLIHAEDQSAKDFYLRIAEFEESPTHHRHLLLALKDLRAALHP